MTISEFVKSDGEYSQAALRALWLAGQGQWVRAHEVAQADGSREGAWIHAYLHRVEGDTSNADYWYQRAGHPRQSGDLQAEWKMIAEELLRRLDETTAIGEK
jgi:hypothetical protein